MRDKFRPWQGDRPSPVRGKALSKGAFPNLRHGSFFSLGADHTPG